MPEPASIAGTAYGTAIGSCCEVAESPPGPSPTAVRMAPMRWRMRGRRDSAAGGFEQDRRGWARPSQVARARSRCTHLRCMSTATLIPRGARFDLSDVACDGTGSFGHILQPLDGRCGAGHFDALPRSVPVGCALPFLVHCFNSGEVTFRP
jgi:hypothetical protein